MAKYLGTVQKSDLEGGCWLLRSDQGVIYQLKGGGADLLQDGQRVEVEGDIATSTMGIAMVGDILEVSSFRVLD